jgi:transcriptional regulator with XRE-family HTH domain
MVLLRRLLGDVLRRHRVRQSRTLREVSAAAQVSLGYLSEVERGRKEASSELLAAICAALDVSLADVLREVSDDLAALEHRSQPVGFRPTVARQHPQVAGAVAGVAPLVPGAGRAGRVPAVPARAVSPVAPVAEVSARALTRDPVARAPWPVAAA